MTKNATSNTVVSTMDPINFFNATAYLDPKCPRCAHHIEYGATTEWDDKQQAHVCKSCHTVLR